MSTLDSPYGFWSYVHADNDAEGGRIIRLSEKIKAEYELITGGNQLELFVDRSNIEWGDKWRSVIDDALTETAFFIPIVTERYFKRPECRRELLRFAANARRRGVPELVLPIVYLEVADLNENSRDEARATVASTQYESWIDLRFEDESGPAYRRAINRLAVRLAAIAEDVSTRPEVILEGEDSASGGKMLGDDDEDEAPGVLDALANAEAELPIWVETIGEFQAAITEIGELFVRYTPTMENAPTLSAKVVTARRLAKELDPLADNFVELGNRYLDQARSMDGNVTVIINQYAGRTGEEEASDGVEEFFDSLRELVREGAVAIESVRGFQANAVDVGKLSKDIRKPLKKVAQGAQSFIDGQSFFESWTARLDELE